MLDHDRLTSLLYYNPETGIFTWKDASGKGRNRCSKQAGTPDHYGYLVFSVDGKQYKAHRLAWLYIHREWPKGQIDHKNRNKQDNRIANLRDATICQNRQNRKRKRNKVGLTGVYQRPNGKYFSIIQANGKRYELGSFDDKLLAHNAYMDAKKRFHGAFSTGE